MKQRGGRRLCDPAIAVGHAGHDVFLHARDAAQPRNAVEGGDEMHFAGAGVGEAHADLVGDQRVDEAFRPIEFGL